jgi:hypothetical protein
MTVEQLMYDLSMYAPDTEVFFTNEGTLYICANPVRELDNQGKIKIESNAPVTLVDPKTVALQAAINLRNKLCTHPDDKVKTEGGETWCEICDHIISSLGDKK